MARASGSRGPETQTPTLAIRTRDTLAQNAIITPVSKNFIPTQADQCPFPNCENKSPHHHSPAEGKIAPLIEECRQAGEAIRTRWTEEQRRLIASTEAQIRQPAGPEPTTLPIRSAPNPPIQASHNHNTSIPLAPTITSTSHSPPQHATTTPCNPDAPCTGPCPVQTPHNQGAYLQRGQVPRVWNARWGYSDPPRGIWEAWVRVERGRGSSWDRVEVDGFAVSHWWGGA